MDKKYTIIGAICIGLSILLMFWNSKQEAEQVQHQSAIEQKEQPKVIAPAPQVKTSLVSDKVEKDTAVVSTPIIPATKEEIFSIENDKIKLNISSHGGALKTVVFKEQATSKTDKTPLLFNEESKIPALVMADEPKAIGAVPTAWNVNYTVEKTEKFDAGVKISLIGNSSAGFQIRRVYTLYNESGENKDPYLVGHEIKIKKVNSTYPMTKLPLLLSTGVLPPTKGDTANIFLNASWFDGNDYEKVKTSEFVDSSGFLGFGEHKAFPEWRTTPKNNQRPIHWIAVTNQYFAGIINFPKQVQEIVREIIIQPVDIPQTDPNATAPEKSLIAYAHLDIPALEVGSTVNLSLQYYVGPKEYTRLSDLMTTIPNVDYVVQFTSLFGFISIDWLCKILVVIMNAIYAIIPENSWAWGWAIFIMTLIIKGITWPLTAAQQRSAKKMQKFQGPMKEIREKYKNDPQRMQQETMKLYRENKINPLAGCFPILIQIPIFFGMYCAFQTCAELRLQGFLWIPDLSMPDVIPGLETIAGFPVHILPILMGVTMILNMRLTPMPSANPGQKQMFYAMMVIFPIICYTMPSALTLYWTLQNIFTIFQTWLVRSRKNDENELEVISTPTKKKKGRGKNRA